MIAVNVTEKLLSPLNNRKDENAHKGTFGKAYLVAGSVGMSGAAILSTKSAVKSGAGLVFLSTVKENYNSVATSVFEAIQKPLTSNPDGIISADENNLSIIKQQADKSDAVLFGCGIGGGEDRKKILKTILSSDCKKIVIDADGINAMEGNIDILCSTNKDIIITPHVVELSRLIDISKEEILKQPLQIASSLAQKAGITVVLKGHETVTATKDGACFINITGNCGMAKGGSGDVLSGIITSFLAQGLDIAFSAFAGVYVHGLAGDIAAEDKTKNCLLPTDIIEYLPMAFKKVLHS